MLFVCSDCFLTEQAPNPSNMDIKIESEKNGSSLHSQDSPLHPSIVDSNEVAVLSTTSVQSPQHSQESSSSSELQTPVHSTAPKAQDDDDGETPIPPPRRKRKSTRKRKVLLSKGSESSLDPLSPDEPARGSNGVIDGQRSPDQLTPSHDQAASISASDQSHEHSSDVISQSPDPFSEEDLFTHNSTDGLDSSFEAAKQHIPTLLERNSDSVVGVGSDAPSSRTSLTVMVDSSSTGGQRPYSMLVSPYDVNSEFSFPEEISRIGGLVTMPRNAAQTWSPHSQLISKRLSQRSSLLPSSSM